jgi:hypothetical protein
MGSYKRMISIILANMPAVVRAIPGNWTFRGMRGIR